MYILSIIIIIIIIILILIIIIIITIIYIYIYIYIYREGKISAGISSICLKWFVYPVKSPIHRPRYGSFHAYDPCFLCQKKVESAPTIFVELRIPSGNFSQFMIFNR